MILFFAVIAAYLLRKSSASVRYLIWSTTVYLIVSIPVIHYTLPHWNLPLVERSQKIQDQAQREPVNFEQSGLANQRHQANPTINNSTEAPSVADSSWQDFVVSFVDSINWIEAIILIWLAIAALIYSRLLFGLLSIWWIAKRSNPVNDKGWNLLVIDLCNQLHLKRLAKIIISPKASTPMTWGVFQPIILLPDDAHNWTMDRLKVVLIHELAHVKRKDFITHLVTQLVSALLWFNPLVWFVSKQLIHDREHACDDHVLLDGTKASDYAAHLLDIARALKENRQSTLASVCMAKRSQLEGRLLSLLDDERG
ncbi:MAG: M56 family metallopeptidase, partial [Calditrichaeota bacterium]|nr:M56 family metallopeptidase [Calditrichota bacterium]